MGDIGCQLVSSISDNLKLLFGFAPTVVSEVKDRPVIAILN